jgi:hypothetical protein
MVVSSAGLRPEKYCAGEDQLLSEKALHINKPVTVYK